MSTRLFFLSFPGVCIVSVEIACAGSEAGSQPPSLLGSRPGLPSISKPSSPTRAGARPSSPLKTRPGPPRAAAAAAQGDLIVSGSALADCTTSMGNSFCAAAAKGSQSQSSGAARMYVYDDILRMHAIGCTSWHLAVSNMLHSNSDFSIHLVLIGRRTGALTLCSTLFIWAVALGEASASSQQDHSAV